MNDSNKLAEERTDWAEDRTTLANERTFAGWMRTGMAAVAVAVGLQVVFREIDPTWLGKAVASLFLLIALFIFWAGQRRARATDRRLSHHDTNGKPNRTYMLIAGALALGTAAIGLVLWLL